MSSLQIYNDDSLAPLRLLAMFLKSEMQSKLVAQGHKVTSTLVDSINVTVKEAMQGFEITGSAIFYAKYVDSGRRIGAKGIPLDVLIEWMRNRRMMLSGRSEQSQAFALQKSIKNKGIKASLFITSTLNDNEDVIDQRIDEACLGTMDAIIDQMFNNLK